MRRNLVVLAMLMALVGAACAGASSADAPSPDETAVGRRFVVVDITLDDGR